jgi:ABC-type sulfate transport system substrate-binding protein
MTDMLRFGPSKYDVAVVYESLALAQIGTADGRWGKLRLYYPATTLWSDHPVEILQAPWVTEAQRVAARAFVAHLKSRPIQELAVTFGFRPADPTIPLKTADAKNPFARLSDRGVKLDIPPMASPPSGEVVRTMLQMWSRNVTR